MGVSVFNTPQRDQLLGYAQSMKDGGVNANNAVETGVILNGPAQVVHQKLASYVIFSLGGPVTINVQFGVTESFVIFDADKNWNMQPVTVNWLDNIGGIVHTEVFSQKNGVYTVFEVAGAWYSNRLGVGECILLF